MAESKSSSSTGVITIGVGLDRMSLNVGAMSAIGVRPAREWMGSCTAKCVQKEDANVADVTYRCQLNTLTAMRMSARHAYQNIIGNIPGCTQSQAQAQGQASDIAGGFED